MQDVLAQETAEGASNVEKDSTPWGFLHKSVCKDSVLVRDMVKED